VWRGKLFVLSTILAGRVAGFNYISIRGGVKSPPLFTFYIIKRRKD
jgi:hypothetical protein